MKTKINTVKPIAGVITDTHLDENSLPVVVEIFKQFIDLLIENNIFIAFFLGDWFNKRSGQSLLCQLATKQILAYFEENEIQLICIPGNHDKTDYTSKLSYLHTYNFQSIERKNWYENSKPILIDDPSTITLEQAPKLSLNLVPYFREDVYVDLCQQFLNLEQKTNKKRILFSHIAVNGARNNDGSVVTNGVSFEFFKQNFDAVYCGHYHNAHSCYIGSAYQRDFGENEHKGFHLLMTDGSLQFHKSIFKPYYSFEVEATNKNKLRSTLKQVEPALLRGDSYVRIIFTGGQDELDSIDVTGLRKLGIRVNFKNTKEFLLDFEDLDEAEFHVLTREEIKKYYLQYTKEYKFTPQQRSQGFKILQTNL